MNLSYLLRSHPYRSQKQEYEMQLYNRDFKAMIYDN